MKKALRILAIAFLVLTTCICVGTAIPNAGTETDTAAYAAALRQGSSGATVKKVQQKLKNWGYYSGSVDGIYGKNTVAAVKLFQKKNGLTVDGIAGTKTLATMGITSSGSQSQSGSYSDSDVALLARLIYGEARGESYVGQVAVGAVVMNRIKSASFPNTMAGVIYQSYAFTAVNDGQINLTPNATAKKAAQDAMNGWDPTYGAIYYYNPAIATSSWIFSRKTTVTIGNHVFAK
jgi:spore cortex-lytic enzyme